MTKRGYRKPIPIVECYANYHGSRYAYEIGCRCVLAVILMRDAWREQDFRRKINKENHVNFIEQSRSFYEEQLNFTLKFYREGLSKNELAEKLGVSITTVRRRLHKLRDRGLI